MESAGGAVYGNSHIIHGVERKYLLQGIIGQRLKEADRETDQTDACHPKAGASGRRHEMFGKPPFPDYGHNGKNYRYQIEKDHHCHDRQQIAEQLSDFTGIGRDDIEEHIDGNDGTTVHVEQHELESGEKHHDYHPERSAPDMLAQ